MKKYISRRFTTLLIAIAYIIVTISIPACSSNNDKTATATQPIDSTSSIQNKEMATYQCPMDCEKGKTYDKAGQCPVCNMDLEKIN